MGELLKVGQLADYLQVRRPTIYRWIRDHGLPALKVGTRWRFRQEDIDEWMEKSISSNFDEVPKNERARYERYRLTTYRTPLDMAIRQMELNRSVA